MLAYDLAYRDKKFLRFVHNLTDCSLYYFALSTQKPVLKRRQLSIDIIKDSFGCG
jgi:hypothetical protein